MPSEREEHAIDYIVLSQSKRRVKFGHMCHICHHTRVAGSVMDYLVIKLDGRFEANYTCEQMMCETECPDCYRNELDKESFE